MRLRIGISGAWRLGWLLAAPVVVAGLLLLLAVPLGINRMVPFAALLCLRAGLTVLACAGAVMAAATVPWRRGRPLVAPLGLSLLLLGVVSGAVVVSRGFANPVPPHPTAGQLRILSWNTNGGLVDPSVVAGLAARLRADVVVLPDAGIAGAYSRAFEGVGHPMRLDAASGPSAQIAVFVAAPYDADYEHVTTGPDPDRTLRITSDVADLPTIVALHAPQPTFHGTDPWNVDLTWVTDQCRSGEVVAVGDFNATVDSFGASTLGHCADAATARHAGSVGTWPTVVPTWLGMPLDHVLATPGWHARAFSVITDEDGSGALHRPVFAVLAR